MVPGLRVSLAVWQAGVEPGSIGFFDFATGVKSAQNDRCGLFQHPASASALGQRSNRSLSRSSTPRNPARTMPSITSRMRFRRRVARLFVKSNHQFGEAVGVPALSGLEQHPRASNIGRTNSECSSQGCYAATAADLGKYPKVAMTSYDGASGPPATRRETSSSPAATPPGAAGPWRRHPPTPWWWAGCSQGAGGEQTA